MPYTTQPPVVTEHPDGSKKVEHPCYAQIYAGRVSGGAILYGSDFQHQHYVSLHISSSVLYRDLSDDRAHDGDRYIEINMSEAQWATLVSSLNVGGGVQCTLSYLQGRGQIPQLPKPEDRRKQFLKEAEQDAAEAFAALDQLVAAIGDAKLSGVKKSELERLAERVRTQLTSSMPFVLAQFGEHMERTVEEAKIEINSFLTQTVARTGLQALTGEVQEATRTLRLEGE